MARSDSTQSVTREAVLDLIGEVWAGHAAEALAALRAGDFTKAHVLAAEQLAWQQENADREEAERDAMRDPGPQARHAQIIRMQIEGFAKSIENRAEWLRRLAVELDRHARRARTVGTPDFQGGSFANNLAWFAAQVQHDVISVLPNLALDGLTGNAYDIDSQRAQGGES